MRKGKENNHKTVTEQLVKRVDSQEHGRSLAQEIKEKFEALAPEVKANLGAVSQRVDGLQALVEGLSNKVTFVDSAKRLLKERQEILAAMRQAEKEAQKVKTEAPAPEPAPALVTATPDSGKAILAAPAVETQNLASPPPAGSVEAKPAGPEAKSAKAERGAEEKNAAEALRIFWALTPRFEALKKSPRAEEFKERLAQFKNGLDELWNFSPVANRMSEAKFQKFFKLSRKGEEEMTELEKEMAPLAVSTSSEPPPLQVSTVDSRPTRNCSSCGAPAIPDARFCDQCGYELKGAPSSEVKRNELPSAAPVASETPPATPEPAPATPEPVPTPAPAPESAPAGEKEEGDKKEGKGKKEKKKKTPEELAAIAARKEAERKAEEAAQKAAEEAAKKAPESPERIRELYAFHARIKEKHDRLVGFFPADDSDFGEVKQLFSEVDTLSEKLGKTAYTKGESSEIDKRLKAIDLILYQKGILKMRNEYHASRAAAAPPGAAETAAVPTPTLEPATPASTGASAKRGLFRRIADKAIDATGAVMYDRSFAGRFVDKAWEKSREMVLNKKVAKGALKGSWEWASKVFGFQGAMDIIGWLPGLVNKKIGFGNLHRGLVSHFDNVKDKKMIEAAFNEFYEGFKNYREEYLAASPPEKKEIERQKQTRVTEKVKALRKKIEQSEGVSKEERAEFLRKLGIIFRVHEVKQADEKTKAGVNVEKAMGLYVKNKVSGTQLVRDIFDSALTGGGFVLLRGVNRFGATLIEKTLEVNAAYSKAAFGREKAVDRLKSIFKETFLTRAIKTARSLAFMGEKEGTKGTQRTLDFLKAAFGTVTQGLAIYGVSIAGGELTSDTWDRLLKSLDSNNPVGSIWDNYKRNADRVFKLPHKLIRGIFGSAPVGVSEAASSATAAVETHRDASLPPATPAETTPNVIPSASEESLSGSSTQIVTPNEENVSRLRPDHAPESEALNQEELSDVGGAKIEVKIKSGEGITQAYIRTHDSADARDVVKEAKAAGWFGTAEEPGEYRLRQGVMVEMAQDGSLPNPKELGDKVYFVPKGEDADKVLEMVKESTPTQEATADEVKEAALALDNSRKMAEMSSLVIDTMTPQQQSAAFDALEALLDKRHSVPPEQFAQMFNELYTATTGLPPETLEAARGAEYRDQLKDIFARRGGYKQELVDNLDRLAKEKVALGSGLAGHNVSGSGGGLASPELQKSGGGGAGIKENISPRVAKVIAEAKQEFAAGRKAEVEKIIADAKEELAEMAPGEESSAEEQADTHYHTLDNTESRTWKLSALAIDKNGTSYEVRVFEDKKVAVYVRESDGLIYNRKGNLIGFTGSDHKLHLHPPKSGWGEISTKGVGEIKNKFEGTGKLPDFSKYKSPKI